jgi:hypothetical protein
MMFLKKSLVHIIFGLAILISQQGFLNPATAAVIATAQDPTRDLSKSERKKISFEVWVASPTAKYVKEAESHNNCKSTGGKGKYQGTWQVSAGFWKTYGGKKYAEKASKATCLQQDLVAYKGWLARGWSPWPPAKKFKP